METQATRTRRPSRRAAPARGVKPARQQRHQRLLTRALENPRSALRDRRCRREPFLSDFFKLCHGQALERPAAALDFASVAIELAEASGDRCALHRAHGVRVHALIACQRQEDAAQVLDDYHLSALACCPSCASDWHLRSADLSLESSQLRKVVPSLDLSLDRLGPDATPDQRARRCFLRSILHHFRLDPGRALADAETVLRDLDLASPKGYFLDTLAFIACFLERSRRPEQHDPRALAILRDFRRRLRGKGGMTAVRVRLGWVEGQVHARLGDWRVAHERLAKAQKDLARDAPPKHVLAAGLDRCQLWAERPNDATRREILRTLNYYKAVLELEPALKSRLQQVIKAVSQKPQLTPVALARLRGSYIVPVPGIVVPKYAGATA